MLSAPLLSSYWSLVLVIGAVLLGKMQAEMRNWENLAFWKEKINTRNKTDEKVITQEIVQMGSLT